MGNKASTDATGEPVKNAGYRVLGVQPNSPASKGGLVSFFDFIVRANGVDLNRSDSMFVDLIREYEEKTLVLEVYNWKAKTIREVHLIPSKNWPGEGMLGVTIRFDSYLNAEEHLLHVLDVETNSPAELGGLQAETDYLLGTAEVSFHDVDTLHEVLESNINHPVEFYVYNSTTDEVRIVVIMPSTDWGGSGGLFGGSVAQGYLHVLPSQCCQSVGKSVIEGINLIDHHLDQDFHAQESSAVGPVIPSPA